MVEVQHFIEILGFWCIEAAPQLRRSVRGPLIRFSIAAQLAGRLRNLLGHSGARAHTSTA